MLTPDDGRADGRFVSYLNKAKQWRAYDPRLFDSIADSILQGRRVGHVEERAMLPGAEFFSGIIPDDRHSRSSVIASGFDFLRDSELIFFDPDNGIEIKSLKKGHQGSCKYLYWDEIVESFRSGKSVLIYQHFPREERNAFVARIFNDMRERTACKSALCFRTANVAFFLLSQDRHADRMSIASKAISDAWVRQIIPIAG